ncbi:HAD-IIB family hydrolase [Humibacter ginsenosidimutans]|uniref:HAD-IIB family hydrolase n=1 Tax=Humibacter ginsenosidimutans TaxID=2599293 RepID=A0A5B8M7B2_9MICO|nr:HAD-IIB family hydrolase [Humibacter ginsenosidimutans]QDZ16427.1 HAD-IIB family hydrolase [Humibacter ginsenosidimutans]
MTAITTQPRLVAFDLDDTLAASKSPLSPAMAQRLLALLDVVPVCIISGGQFGQFSTQVVERLADASPAALERLHLMPTCGTQYFRFADGAWTKVYAQDLSDDEKTRALTAVEQEAKRLGYWEEQTWGAILEDRGSQITFSALGQQAPVDAKAAWDPTGEKKSALRAAVQELLPDLEVRSGGSTSVDITRRGIDKAYGIGRLSELTGIRLTEMLFIGDRLDPDGNDYPVLAMGVPTLAVSGWEHTIEVLDELIPRLAAATAG